MLIGDLADRSGVPAKTLRFYEAAGVLPAPPRTAGGYRNYDDGALDRLAFIRSAKAAGLTLAEIRGVIAIREAGSAPCSHVAGLLDAKAAAVTHQIAELRKLEAELDLLREQAAAANPDACHPRSVCHVLSPVH